VAVVVFPVAIIVKELAELIRVMEAVMVEMVVEETRAVVVVALEDILEQAE
jgi:hypothetical protein